MSRHAVEVGPERRVETDQPHRLSSVAGCIWSMRSPPGPMRVVVLRIYGAEPGSMVEMVDFGTGNELVQSMPAHWFDGTRPDIDRTLIFSRVPAGSVVLVCLTRKARAVELYLREVDSYG